MENIACAGLMAGVPLSTNGFGESSAGGLNPTGLLILIVAVGGILTLVVWCYVSLLRSRDSDTGSDAEGR